MKPSVYLAGPITGLTYDGASDWRSEVTNLMSPEIDCYSPMRGKDYLLNRTTLDDQYDEWVLSTQRGIMVRDFNDCKERDGLFVNLLGAQKVSIGTVMEIAWGYAFRKPTVVVMEREGNPHEHAMIREADILRVDNINDGIALIRTILLP